jgi:hypothetical protein
MNVYEKTLFSILILNKCPFPEYLAFVYISKGTHGKSGAEDGTEI